MNKVMKHPVTTLSGVKVGHMLTCNYDKPSQHAVTVTQLGETDWGTRWVEVVDRDAVYQIIKESDLADWDLSSVNKYE